MLSYGLSTLETIVADFGGNLSPKTATVAKFGDCRQNRRQQSPVLATVAELGDRPLRQHAQLLCVLATGDSPPTPPTDLTGGSEIGANL